MEEVAARRMLRPSRVQRREMVAIVRDNLGAGCAEYQPIEMEDGGMYGSTGGPHEEGWSRFGVTVWPADGSTADDRSYVVRFESAGRDCDGPHSSERTAIVKKRSKCRRFYTRSTPGARGRFILKHRWVVLEESRSRQRDVFAERMGY